VVKLGEIFEIQQGKALSPKARSGNRQRPFLRTANILWGRIDLTVLDEMHFEPIEEQRLALQPGDLLVCEGGDIGRTAMWEDQLPLCLYQNHLHRLRPIRVHSVEPAFYMYWMEAAWRLFGLYGGSANRTTIPNLSRSRLASFPVPLPPLAEQRAIAYVLRAVQRAREATERVIAAARTLKKSLMRHLFTYGAVPIEHAERIPMQDTELGPLPAHWQVVKLGEVGEIVTGKTPSTSEPRYWNGSIPFITPADLDKGEIYSTERTITQEGLAQVKAVARGAVLVSCIGYIGKVGMVGVEIAATNQQINSIIPNTTVVDRYYLFYGMQTDMVQKILDQLTRKTTVPILHKSNFSKVNIPLPPLDEQIEIARILQAVDRKIKAEETRWSVLEGQFKTLLYELMTARIRLPAGFIAQFTEQRESTPSDKDAIAKNSGVSR
jgi:type I restriction enzyme S subunit